MPIPTHRRLADLGGGWSATIGRRELVILGARTRVPGVGPLLELGLAHAVLLRELLAAVTVGAATSDRILGRRRLLGAGGRASGGKRQREEHHAGLQGMHHASPALHEYPAARRRCKGSPARVGGVRSF